jgi:hypothetical protein
MKLRDIILEYLMEQPDPNPEQELDPNAPVPGPEDNEEPDSEEEPTDEPEGDPTQEPEGTPEVKQKVKKQVLGIDKIRKLVLRIKNIHWAWCAIARK